MPRALSFVVFFVVVLSLAGSLHYYVWARLVRDVALPLMWHRILTGLIIALFASIPLTFTLARGHRVESLRPVLLGTFSWMGLLFLTVMLLLVVDAGRVGLGLAGRLLETPPDDPERRLALTRMLGVGVALVAGGAGTLAARSGLTELMVKRLTVALPRLPAEMNGTTIAQLSDVHVGSTIQRGFIERVVRETNALEPDVIVITGDLVDGSVAQLADHVAPLGDLRAKYGVFFVTGNHEYYSGAEAWCHELERLGIRVLRNERVQIGEGAVSYDLAGVDDYSAHRFGRGHGADLKKAVAGRDDSRELVLLAHQPRQVFEADRLGVGLQLSGHTHGGQIFPWNIFVRLQQPVVSGLARFGRALVYVSNGTGYWGPPMRLGAPAEITLLTLERAAS
ncbi:MAG: metallophosphoesterase [Myxococcales bacterium]|nr:metallophosphoesterase [Myxococcales bacterium]